MVPTMFVRMLALPERRSAPRYDLSSLRWVVHAAAPCPADVKRAMIEWLGPIVVEYYGGTETGPVVFCTSEEWLAHPGTVGRPLEQAVVKILDARRRRAARPASRARSTCGSTSGPTSPTNGDEEKRRVGRARRPRQLRRHRLRRRRRLSVSQRSPQRHGDQRRREHLPRRDRGVPAVAPGVRDCAVFGIPDDEFGEALAAHVELHDGTRADRRRGARLTCASARRLQDAARGRVQRRRSRARTPARSSSAACASPTGAGASARSDGGRLRGRRGAPASRAAPLQWQ